MFALRSCERNHETTQIIVNYSMRMSDLLVMLYDIRYVNSSFPIQPLPASKHFPDPSAIDLALKVSQAQCAEALTIMEDRAKAEEGAKARNGGKRSSGYSKISCPVSYLMVKPSFLGGLTLIRIIWTSMT